MPPLSLYIHFPWCIRKCPYCDFNSHAVKESIPEAKYVEALLRDLERDLAWFGLERPVVSIFMGGGTPSLFSPAMLDRLLAWIRGRMSLADDCEITLEANPGTFESGKFREFRALGINRLSIGIQSFQDRHLQMLGRVHSAAEATKAAEIAVAAGFENFNLDLMFGLPGQSEPEAFDDVRMATNLRPAHISFYQLTFEPNTYFHKFPPRLPDDEVIFAAQQRCQDWLAEHGYRQYEVSAYAAPTKQCRHNRNYWRFGDYLGIGAGAHGKISLALPDNIVRTAKPRNPDQYLREPWTAGRTRIELNELPLEFAMNRLRLRDGFSLSEFEVATGLSGEVLTAPLRDGLADGLLELADGFYRCSARGWDFLDVLLEKFVPE